MTGARAVLLMAYGTPGTLEDVESYFTHIRGGRTPSAEAVKKLRDRYERIGGGTPLLRTTMAVRAGLETELSSQSQPQAVYVGMKHWHPYIAETMERMRDDGIRQVTAVALAPHYSRMSVGAYRHTVEEANHALGSPFEITFVDRWYQDPLLIDLLASLVKEGLEQFDSARRASVAVVFTAHSLPVRIREWNDPYEGELLESASSVAVRAGIGQWRFAWQSAGGTTEPWIGPDILEYLDELHREGVRDVLQVPIGFVADHLEILYDIDIEATEKARTLGMTLHRTRLPNASPAFVRVLANVVRKSAKAYSPA